MARRSNTSKLMPAANKRKKKPVSASGSGVGLDFISFLPDCLLITHILSLLPLKDCARTSALSTRWRHLWTLAPLHLNDLALRREKFPDRQSQESWGWHEDRAWCIGAVNQILSVHRGPILSFHIPRYYIDIAILNGWLQTFTQRGIQYLNLTTCDSFDQLTPSLASCKTLRALRLTNIHILQPPVHPQPFFVNLKELVLWGGKLSDATVHHLLSNCQALQILSLLLCTGLHRLRISSPTIRALRVYTNSPIGEILVQDAPNLERLMIHDVATGFIPTKVVHAPKVELVYVRLRNFEAGTTLFSV